MMANAAVSSSANGNNDQIPSCSATPPAANGASAPPTMLSPTSTPMAVATRWTGASRGTTAIVVGNNGPRKKPIITKPTAATAEPGTSHTTSEQPAAPARQPAM